jgi:hypothetical protein
MSTDTLIGGLGRVCDFSVGIAPVDSQTAAMTAKRFSMQNCGGVMIVAFKAAGVAADDPTYTLYEHTAYTGGTSTALTAITNYALKQETALDGDEAWVETAQTKASTLVGNATSGESQHIIVIDVRAEQLTAGYTHISLDMGDTGAGGTQPACVLYVPYDLKMQRRPNNMPNWLNPGAANA